MMIPGNGSGPDPLTNDPGYRCGSRRTLGKKFVDKRRVRKAYRRPELDARLISERTRAEARLIASARRAGVPTPVILEITGDTIPMERIFGSLMKDTLRNEHLEEAGRTVGTFFRNRSW